MADEACRNFRSYYYGKVGCRGIEEKKSLEILLNEDPLDKEKISHFCLRFTVPALYRLQLWKILFGIEGLFPEHREFIQQQKQEHFEMLKDPLFVMKKVDETTPVQSLLLYMYLLEQGVILSHMDSSEDAEYLKAIINACVDMFDSEFDAFWISRNFYRSRTKHSIDNELMVESVSTILKREDLSLLEHLQKINGLQILPFKKWLFQGFAGVLSVTSLERLWDKLIAGSTSISSYVIASMMLTLRKKIKNIDNSISLLQFLLQISEVTAEDIVTSAIDNWLQHGSQ
ncbi:TBC1 domain family member 7 [Nymphon striatum]|nr:TBC1 domain family member 7 [Nymphon striatum]